jgi:hypothetical protein
MDMRRGAVIGPVVLIFLVGMTVPMGMHGIASCPHCPGMTPWSMTGLCVAVLSFFALLVHLLSSNLALLRSTVRPYLLVRRLDRPPRLV